MATITSNPPSPSPSTLSSSSGSGFSTSSNSTSSSSSSMSATSVTSSAPSTAVAYNGPTRVRFDNACVLIPQKCKNKFLGKGVVIPSFLAPTAGNRRARTQSHTHKTCLRTPSPAPPSPCSLASPSSPTPPSSFPSLPPSTSPKPKFARIVRSASFSILFPSPASDDKRIPLRACCPDCVTPTEEAHLIEERFSEGARWLRQGESPCLELGPLPVIPLMPVLEKEKPLADEDEDDLFPLPSPRKCQPPDEDDAFPLPRSRADKRKSVILGAGLPLRGGKEPEDRLAEGAGLVRRTSAVKRCDSPLSFEDNTPPPADSQSTALIPASKPIPTIVVRPGSSHSHRHKRSMSDSHIRTGGLRPDSCAHVERQCEVHAHKRKPKKVFAGFKWL